MEKNTKIVVGVGFALVAGASLYFGFMHKGKDGMTWYERVTSTSGNNFKLVKKNLGGTYPDGPIASVRFDNKNYQADFYNNGRVIVSKVGANGYLVKGSYQDGGLTIILDNGKNISSSSVWNNLLQTVK